MHGDRLVKVTVLMWSRPILENLWPSPVKELFQALVRASGVPTPRRMGTELGSVDKNKSKWNLENNVNKHKLLIMLIAICFLCLSEQIARSQAKPGLGAVSIHMVITDAALRDDAEPPALRKEDVKVKRGKDFLQVTQLIPAQGDNAALQLMILIDETLNTSIGNNLNDVKDFITAQPASTVVGVGYMSNAGVNIAQNFTADKDLAVKAVRLPRGNLSTMDSPYLSLINLVKGWPQQNVRRVVLMVTDGIDRLRGETPQPTRLGPNY